MFSALDISTSALVAQRTRLNTISANVANIGSVQDEQGRAKPYQPKFVVFEADEAVTTGDGAVGVKVGEVRTDDAEPLMKYEPTHPLADADGYVAYPNVNLTAQFVDALEASRAYEANIGVLEMSKGIGSQTLRILG